MPGHPGDVECILKSAKLIVVQYSVLSMRNESSRLMFRAQPETLSHPGLNLGVVRLSVSM